jgi:hypothetical protein
MNDVVKTILTDQFAGRAGVFRFDPAIGQRSRVVPATAIAGTSQPANAVQPDVGQQPRPENGEPAK